jgi:alpha-L-fucosidase
VLDPLKLHIAAYYYNRAREWGKEVSMSTKFNAYAPSNDDTEQIGSIIDFEKVGTRSPAGIRPGAWMVDDPIGSNSWGYVEDLRLVSADGIIARLVDTVSKGGMYMLNISPMADGTIPENQQEVMRKIGAWLARNGEAIYETRPWKKFGEGGWHFTQKDDALYAIAGAEVKGETIVPGVEGAKSVTMLGREGRCGVHAGGGGHPCEAAGSCGQRRFENHRRDVESIL